MSAKYYHHYHPQIHAPSARPWTSSPYRRRRIAGPLLLVALTGLLYLWIYGAPSFLSLSPALKDAERSDDLWHSAGSSPAGRVAQAKPQLAGQGAYADVREIDALLHFIYNQTDRRLDEDGGTIRVEGLGSVHVDGTAPVDLRVYAANGDYNWAQHTKRIRSLYPLVVFSKTYCPYHSYSQKAKTLLEAYEISPAPKVIEVNVRSDGPQIQKILSRVTGRSTVPNILLKGKSIGGSDELHRIHDEGRLKKLLEDSGFTVNGNPPTSA
ncbi:glutaredoxin [Cubamyces menziesii]|nr:glutaredoxin [Cubamyces menziesii]